MHSQPRHGRGDHESCQDQENELTAEQQEDVANRSAEHLTNADFAGALQRGEGDQPIETDTTDEDRDRGEEAEGGLDLLFLPVKVGDMFVEEFVLE